MWDRRLGLREERAGGRDGEPTQQGQGPSLGPVCIRSSSMLTERWVPE